MSIQDAYNLASQPEPTPEEYVDIFCPNCDTFACTDVSDIHNLGDKYYTTYEHFVGIENCKFDDTKEYGEYYICPNGCTDDEGKPVRMSRFDNTHRVTPWQRWKAAKLVVEIVRLQEKLDECLEEYKGYGDDEFEIL